MPLSIVSNGYISPQKVIPKMIKLEVDSVSVGLDGTRKTHNNIRGLDNAFEKTLNFIDEMTHEIPCYDLWFVPDETGLKYLDSFEKERI